MSEEYDNGSDHNDQARPHEAKGNTQKILEHALADSPGRRFPYEPRCDRSSRRLEERKQERPDDDEDCNGEHNSATLDATI